jgi:general secretion pathway protein D
MRRGLLLALCVALGGHARAADEATVAFNFQDVDLPVLARFVSEATGRNFIVDERVRGKVTVIAPTPITPDAAYLVFQSVLQVRGFTTVPSGAFTKIVPVRDARETTVPTGARAGDQVVTRILPLAHAEAAGLVPVLQPLVSKDGLLHAHPPSNSLVVVDAGANVERLAGLLDELDVPARGGTTEVVRLRWAAADEVTARLRESLGGGEARTAGLRVTADARSNAVVLAGAADEIRRARAVLAHLDEPPAAGTSQLHVVPLRYADAGALVRVLSQLVGLPVEPAPPPRPRGSSFMRTAARRLGPGLGYDGGLGEAAPAAPPAPAAAASGGEARAVPLAAPVRFTADPATNTLIVSATPQDWRTLAPVIEALDVRRRQVFVEAIIVEATVDKTRALGVEFQGTTGLDGHAGLAQANLGTLAGALTDPTSLPGLLLAAASNERVRLPNGERVPAHTVLLTALEADADVNVLSAPNILTTDNEEAEIVVGRNVPFVASRATSATNLENLFTTIERHDVGITLRMTPQISGDDFVHLTVFEEVSDIDPTASAAVGDPAVVGPTTTVRSASTTIAARDGQTVVIGGLLADTLRTTERRVPFLGRLPVLGALFRREDDRRTKTNLLVFLTPHVIASDARMAENALRERERMRAALPRPLRDRGPLTAPTWAAPPP